VRADGGQHLGPRGAGRLGHDGGGDLGLGAGALEAFAQQLGAIAVEIEG
jgi:hypothetical protein